MITAFLFRRVRPPPAPTLHLVRTRSAASVEASPPVPPGTQASGTHPSRPCLSEETRT